MERKEIDAMIERIRSQEDWNNFAASEIAMALELGVRGGDIVSVWNGTEEGGDYDTILVVANAEGCLNLLTGIFMGADELSWKLVETKGSMPIGTGQLYEIRAWWD